LVVTSSPVLTNLMVGLIVGLTDDVLIVLVPGLMDLGG
jgi:hypothetical protein